MGSNGRLHDSVAPEIHGIQRLWPHNSKAWYRLNQNARVGMDMYTQCLYSAGG